MPAKIYDLRQMPDDIKAEFKARGVDPEDTLIVDDPESNKTEFRSVKELGGSLGKTVGINAAKAILPTLGGAASGAAAMAGVAAMGVPVTGPAGFVPAVASGVGGALVGGGAANALQESVLDKFAPGMQTEAELLRRANPRSATIGQILGGFAGGMNSLKGLVSRAGGVKEAAKIASVPTALGAGLEAYNEYRDEGQIDPLRVGLTAAAGPFQAVNTKAGQLAEDIGSSLVGKLSGKIADGMPIAKPRTRDQISKDILDAHAAGQFTEGSPVYNALAVELNQPGAPADALIKLAQKHAEQNIQNNPEERAKIADMLWESISVKKLPEEQLPQSQLELKLASFIKDGVVNSKEELVNLARQSNLDIAANNLKREKVKAAGPAPSDPYVRMEDAQVEALLNASPDVLPPNAGELDKAIFEGKKKGYVKTAEDIRKLEGAYQVNPDMLPSASRQLWQEKQTPPAVKKAEEAAAAFEKRDIEYFAKEFPKAASEIRRATKNVNDAAALIDDLNTPEDTKAKLRGQAEAAQKSMNESWNNLMKRAFDRYSQIEPPSSAIGPASKDFTWTPGGPPRYQGEPIPVRPIDVEIVDNPSPGAGGLKQLGESPARSLLAGASPVDTGVGSVGRGGGPIITPPPAVKGLLGQGLETGRPTLEKNPYPDIGPMSDAQKQVLSDAANDVRYSSLDPNQNIRKAVEWFAPGLKPLEIPAKYREGQEILPDANKFYRGIQTIEDTEGNILRHMTQGDIKYPDAFTLELDNIDAYNIGGNNTHKGRIKPSNVSRIFVDINAYKPYPTEIVEQLKVKYPGAEIVNVKLNDSESGFVVANPKDVNSPDTRMSGIGGKIEAIRRPAIRVGNEIFEGVSETHLPIMQQLGKRYGIGNIPDFETGFTTTRGRYVDRKEAAIIAKKAKQVYGEVADGQLASEDLDYARYSGLPGKVVGRALDKTVGRLNDLIFEGTIGPRKVWAGTKSVIDRLRDLGPSGKIIADTDLAMRRDTTKVFNTAAAAYVDAYNSLNKRETSRVDQYLNDTFDTKGHSFIILTPKEQAAVDKIRNEGLLYLVDNGIIRGGPGVREGGMYREQRIDPYYIPTVADSKVRKIVKNREKGYEQLAADWEAWYSGKLGMSADDAKNLMQQYLTATGPSSANDAAKFGALTQAEGVGLPPSWRAPTRKALLYHAYRASKNFAWFTHVQRNPQMAKAVGEMDDGWGGKIDTSTATNDSIAGMPAVEAWKAEMNNHLSAGDSPLEDLTRIATAFQLGPLTGLRDIIGTPAHMVELIPGEDVPKIMQALYKVVTSDVRGKMEKAGDIKAKTLQPFEFNASTFSEGTLDKVLEVTRTLNGRNLLESTARQWAYETGRLVGAARLAKGDTAFFEHLKIPDWRSMQPEDLFNATGRAFMDSAQGSYNSRGLPSWLLTSQKNKELNFLFSLQRWGVERYNNWHKNAWQPAVKEGDFKPLLRSVFGALLTSAGLNAIQEYLFNQKPPEMKWSEFMKADNKELPYTIFSKLQNVGFAGIYSSLGMAAAKVKSGEVPEPINNLGWDLAAKGSIRTGQFLHALASGRGADSFDVFTDYLDSMARDNIQAWRLWQNRSRPDIGNREEKIFKRQTGKPGNMSASMSSLLANPMDPTRDFRQATTEEDMQKALPGLDRAFAADPNKDIRIQSPMRPLNESPSYYDFVGQLQGAEAQQAALQRDQQLERLSLLKRQEVMRAKYRAQTVGGPR